MFTYFPEFHYVFMCFSVALVLEKVVSNLKQADGLMVTKHWLW